MSGRNSWRPWDSGNDQRRDRRPVPVGLPGILPPALAVSPMGPRKDVRALVQGIVDAALKGGAGPDLNPAAGRARPPPGGRGRADVQELDPRP